MGWLIKNMSNDGQEDVGTGKVIKWKVPRECEDVVVLCKVWWNTLHPRQTHSTGRGPRRAPSLPHFETAEVPTHICATQIVGTDLAHSRSKHQGSTPKYAMTMASNTILFSRTSKTSLPDVRRRNHRTEGDIELHIIMKMTCRRLDEKTPQDRGFTHLPSRHSTAPLIQQPTVCHADRPRRPVPTPCLFLQLVDR